MRILSDSSHPQVSRTALRSLIGSLDPAAEIAMTELWLSSTSKPEMQNQILIAIIELSAERWTSMVAGYVAGKIQDAASGVTTLGDVAEDTTALPQPTYLAPSDPFSLVRQSAPNQHSLMGFAIAFLRQQRHAAS